MGQRRINRGVERRDDLRACSAERAEIRNKLSPQQQLRALDYRLGKDVGAVKERARLEALIDAGK